MVANAPFGALDPASSNYLFHSGSAVTKGSTTNRQDETMDRNDAGYSQDASYRPVLDQDIINDNVGPNGLETGGILPNESAMPIPVMPNSDGAINPVMPPERNTTIN